MFADTVNQISQITEAVATHLLPSRYCMFILHTYLIPDMLVMTSVSNDKNSYEVNHTLGQRWVL